MLKMFTCQKVTAIFSLVLNLFFLKRARTNVLFMIEMSSVGILRSYRKRFYFCVDSTSNVNSKVVEIRYFI